MGSVSLPVSNNRGLWQLRERNSRLCCGQSTAPLAVPLNKANLAAGLMSSAGMTWGTKLKQNRRYQPANMPGKRVGLGDLGSGTAACETVWVSPKEIISPLCGLTGLVIWRKHCYLCGSVKSHFFQPNKTIVFQIYPAMNMFLRNHRFLTSGYSKIVWCKYWGYFGLQDRKSVV